MKSETKVIDSQFKPIEVKIVIETQEDLRKFRAMLSSACILGDLYGKILAIEEGK
jgi:hypothetical protein